MEGSAEGNQSFHSSPAARGTIIRLRMKPEIASTTQESIGTHQKALRVGLVLDKVVLLGRTLDEYARYFALDLEGLRGRAVLDVASGVSSFCAEANARGLNVTAFDAIYDCPAEKIEGR